MLSYLVRENKKYERKKEINRKEEEHFQGTQNRKEIPKKKKH
jgi:hypothetical protein